jgi:hypothetical protein
VIALQVPAFHPTTSIVRNLAHVVAVGLGVLIGFAGCGGGGAHVPPAVVASPSPTPLVLPLPTGPGTILSPPPAPTGSALTSLLNGDSGVMEYLKTLDALTIVATQKVSDVGIIGHVVGSSANGFTVQPLSAVPTAGAATPALISGQYPTVPSSSQPISVVTSGNTVFDFPGGQRNVTAGMTVAVGGVMQGATLAASLVASVQFSTHYATTSGQGKSRSTRVNATRTLAASGSARAVSSSAETAARTIAFVGGTPFSGVNWESTPLEIGSSDSLKTSVFLQLQVISGFGLAADWPITLTTSAESSPITAGKLQGLQVSALPLSMSGPNPINALSFGSFSWTAGTQIALNLIIRTSFVGIPHDWIVGGPSIGMLASNKTTKPASLTAGEQFEVPPASCPSLGFGFLEFGLVGIPATQIIGFKLCDDTTLVGAPLNAALVSVANGTAGQTAPLQFSGSGSASMTLTPAASQFTATLGSFDYKPRLMYGFTASITSVTDITIYSFPSVVVGEVPIPLDVVPSLAAFNLPAVYCTYETNISRFYFYAAGQQCGIEWSSPDGSETGASFTITNSQPGVASIAPGSGVLGNAKAAGATPFAVTSIAAGATEMLGSGTDARGRAFSNPPLEVTVTNGLQVQQGVRRSSDRMPAGTSRPSDPRATR